MSGKLRHSLLAASIASMLLSAGCNSQAGTSENSASVTEEINSQTESTSAESAEPLPDASEPEEGATGKVLNILQLDNAPFQSYVEQFHPDYTDNGDDTGYIGDIKVVWVKSPPNADIDPRGWMEGQIDKRRELSEDERIDVIVLSSYYAYEFIGKYALPLSEIGITEEDTSQLYSYTTQKWVGADGKLRSLPIEVSPGVFAYRRSVARQVLGTDDPDEVRQYAADWDKFTETAEKLKNGGYHILSSGYDLLNVFAGSLSEPFVNDALELTVPAEILEWAELCRTYTENGYFSGDGMWTDDWADSMTGEGTVFGCFFPAWGVSYTIPGNASAEEVGDWAVCAGPRPYHWGDTQICAMSDTDNPEEVGELLRVMCCDGEVAKSYALSTEVLAGNAAAMDELAASDYSSEFLGGQNPYPVYSQNARALDITAYTVYEEVLVEYALSCFEPYVDGEITLDEAKESFYTRAIDRYPELKRPQ